MNHAMNCGATGFDGFDAGECTCGLEWRIKLGTEQEMHAAWRKRAEDAEKELAEIKTAANVLIDYCEAHNWGIMPEPFASINPLLKLLGRAAESAAIPPADYQTNNPQPHPCPPQLEGKMLVQDHGPRVDTRSDLGLERCPKCGSDERSMLCMECFRNERDPHPWHHS